MTDEHLKNLPKRRKMWWNRKRSLFKKSQKLLAENLHGRPPIQNIQKLRSISKAGYVTAVLAVVRTELAPCREASSFCDLENLLRFTLFYSFFDSSKNFFLMCLVRSIIANLCLVMIHLDALDFNVCCSEKVISCFWRSVYVWCVYFLTVFL